MATVVSTLLLFLALDWLPNGRLRALAMIGWAVWEFWPWGGWWWLQRLWWRLLTK